MLSLKGDLSFDTVTQHQCSLQEAINASVEPIIYLSLAEVDYSDSSGLALLIELRRKSRQVNKTLIFCHMPQQMVALAEFCGVRALL